MTVKQKSCLHMNPRNKDAAIKLWLDEIKYDVEFDSWRKDNVLNAERENSGGKKPLDVSYDNDNANDWLVRQVEDAVDNIYGELAWCTVDDSRFESNEIEEDTPSVWVVRFSFSESWRGSMRRMKSCAHRYVKNYVLSQWYRAGNVPGAEKYEEDAAKALGDLYDEARSERVELEPWRL